MFVTRSEPRRYVPPGSPYLGGVLGATASRMEINAYPSNKGNCMPFAVSDPGLCHPLPYVGP